eukprot:Colp12_sorted_trinity150504_noHs@9808
MVKPCNSFVLGLLNVGCEVLVVVAAFVSMIGSANFANIIVKIYVAFFATTTALMNFCVPAGVGAYFLFVFTILGRGLYFIFLGCLVLDTSGFGLIAGSKWSSNASPRCPNSSAFSVVVVIVMGFLYVLFWAAPGEKPEIKPLIGRGPGESSAAPAGNPSAV